MLIPPPAAAPMERHVEREVLSTESAVIAAEREPYGTFIRV